MTRRYRRGDRLKADDVNGIRDAARRDTRGASPVASSNGPGGRMFQLGGSRPFWAEITGPASSGRYPFRQLCGEPPAPCGVTGSDALEVAGLAVNSGTKVRMYPTTFDHRFSKPCSTCGPPCQACSGFVLPTTLFATFSDGACPNGCISQGFVLPPDMTFDYHPGTGTWRGCAQRPWPFSVTGVVYPDPCTLGPQELENPIVTVRGVLSCGASQFSAQFQIATCSISTGIWSEMPCSLAWTHPTWQALVGFTGVPLNITSCSPLVLSGSHRCINPGFCMDYEVTG